MIIDTLENAGLYSGISLRFSKAFEYLTNTDFNKTETGKYEIDAENIFAMVSEYLTKDEETAKWEAHKEYADIQYIVLGEEKLGCTNLANMEITEAYNPVKDVLFVEGTGDFSVAKAGIFMVFFPHEAHKPGVRVSEKSMVKKVVIKVKLK